MSAVGTTAFRSILDKPLSQLTEDDISQLTREDCRKYLKEKGMRRPSWNKSQAIQQVISLKALLEPGDDSGAGAVRKIVASQPDIAPRFAAAAFSVTSNSTELAKEASGDVQVLGLGEELTKSAAEAEEVPNPATIDADDRASSRSQCANEAAGGQMTIFYSGKVNVYDAIPPEKARAIIHLAANPIVLPRENSLCGTVAPRSFPWNLHAGNDKGGLPPPSAASSQPLQPEKIADYGQQCWEKESDVDGQASRKVSLQRYLEKRKDRGRLKSKRSKGFNSSSLDVYVNQVKTHNSSRSSTTSPTQPAFCSAIQNQPKISCLPVDLNENHNMEC